MTPLAKQLLIPSILLFLAAVIFAGTVWYESQQAKSSQVLRAQFSDVTAAESALPHYAAGNINGTVTGASGNTLTISVIPPGSVGTSTSAAKVTATVIVDPDTTIYKIGTMKDSATFAAESAAYLAARDSNPTADAPDPYEHVVLKVADLTPGTLINVLPKSGSVQGTSLRAKNIIVQSAAPTT